MKTKALQERRRIIINQLSALAKDGWRHAKPSDYQPLERELREIDNQLGASLLYGDIPAPRRSR